VPGLGWLFWDGKRWDRATAGQEMRLAEEAVRGIPGISCPDLRRHGCPSSVGQDLAELPA
jgi:hypothetical protein